MGESIKNLQMIFSPPGCGKTYEIHKRIKELCDNGIENIYLIVPEQISFETEKEMLKLLSAKSVDKVEVLSFSRFADKFYKKFGGRNKRRIDEMGKTAIMELALRKLNNSLDLYSKQINSPVFAKSLIDLDKQMKRFNVTAEDFMQKSMAENGVLSKKLNELSLIFSEYANCLNSEYYDPLDDLTKITNRLDECRYFENSYVFLDSFNGFTAQQLPLVEKIISQANMTTLSFCIDKNSLNDVYGLYSNMFSTAEAIKNMAKKNSVKILPDINLNGYERFNNDELKTVAKCAFRSDKIMLDCPCENIHIAKLSNIYDECEYVASSIRKLIREKNIRFRDISVITRDTEKYNGIIDRVFAKYEIPCFIDAKKGAIGTAIARYALNALESAYCYSTDSILAMLKTGITEFSEDDIQLLEKYLLIWRIDKSDWLSEFCGNIRGIDQPFTEQDKLILERINSIRKKIVEGLLPLNRAVLSGGVKNISNALYQYIVSTKANTGLNVICERLENKAQFTDAGIQRKAYELIIAVLDQLVMSLEKYDVDYKKYYTLFINAINSADIGKLPQGLDEVAIGSAERMRPKSPKVTFIIGANEGSFPAVYTSNGLFSNSELVSLKQGGLELPCYDDVRAIDENYLCFAAMCSPSDELFVTAYCEEDSSECFPSVIIYELQSIFGLELNTIDMTELSNIECEASAVSSFALCMDENSVKKSTLEKYLRDNKGEKYNRLLDAVSDFDPTIKPDIARKIFGDNMTLSASKIDTFYHCPFNYFCSYGLKFNPERPADIDALSRGTLVHLILCEFASRYDDKAYFQMDKSEIDIKIREIVSNSLKDYLSAKKSSGIDIFRINSLCRSIHKMLDILYSELKDTDFSVLETEVSFGADNADDYGCMTVNLSDGTKIRIVGKIDRVDSFEQNGETYIRVIDYKTGRNIFKLSDVLFGQNIQMLLYLAAYEKTRNAKDKKNIKPSGILYFPMKDKIVSVTLDKTPDEIAEEKLSANVMNGFLLNDENSINAMNPKGKNILSPIIKSKDDTNFMIHKDSSTYNIENYDVICEHLERLIIKMGDVLHSGDIKIDPIDGETEACAYCDYNSICRRDTDVSCKKVPKLNDSEVLKKMSEGEKADEEV